MKKQRSRKGYKNIIRVLTIVIIILTITNIKQYKNNHNDFLKRYVGPGEEITLYTSNTQIRIISDQHKNGDVYTDVITESLRKDHHHHTEMEDEYTHYSVIQSPLQVERWFLLDRASLKD